MDYQRIVDELRRKAEKLSDAADTIEAVYLGSQEDATEAAQPAKRWAPGRGEPEPEPAPPTIQSTAEEQPARAKAFVNPKRTARNHHRKKAKPAPVPPARPSVSAPRRVPSPAVAAIEEEVVAELDKKTHLALITGIREMLTIGVARQVLPQTVVNWCAAKGMSVNRQQVDDAIAEATRAA